MVALLAGACGSEAASPPENPLEAPEAPPDSLVREPLQAFPQRLSQVGLYADGADVSRTTRDALAYEPGYPLWSDGGHKARFLVLPLDSAIEAESAEQYTFPIGTLLFKTFSYYTPDSPERMLPVETRVLRLSESGWQYEVYAWDEPGTDAHLLDLRRSEARLVLSDRGDEFEHHIPSRLECRQCHESASSPALGLNELQLARSGDLAALAGRITPRPPEQPLAIDSGNATTDEVLGYFFANCVHCHNGGNGAASSFDLRPDVALDNVIDRDTESSASAAGIRVVPGAPEQSVLYQAMSGTGGSEVKDMPPIGVALRDAEGIALVHHWITTLPSGTSR